MLFLTILAFSFFISPVLSMRILDWDMDFPGLATLGDDTSHGTALVARNAQLLIKNCMVSPDGGPERNAVCVNGIFPAPLITAEKDDQFNIDLVNELDPEGDTHIPSETSVANGVSYVTQCPLRQHETFKHRFNADGQTGTYWYHSHYRAQYCDGLRGPLVIRDPEDPFLIKKCTPGNLNDPLKNRCCDDGPRKDSDGCYNKDEDETVITLADWYHKPSSELEEFFPTPTEKTKSMLINGKGRYEGTKGDLSFIDVEEGSRHRLRVVSMTCNDEFDFSIDDHQMTIIEVDGIEVEPVVVGKLPIYPAQRYSVVITANRPGGRDSYWIRAPRIGKPAIGDGQAILRYNAKVTTDPTSSSDTSGHQFNEGNLRPIVNPGAPGSPGIGNADVKIAFAVGNTSNSFTMNDVSFEPPSMPVLLQILSGKNPWELMPRDSIYELPLGKVVEISFPYPTNAIDPPHPMHLHGHAFDVVQVAGSTETNFKDPVRRDTVSIGDKDADNVVIRFKTDNPGPWFLHCHNDWHLSHGFAVVMAEAIDETKNEQSKHVPQDQIKVCPPGEDWGQKKLPGY